MTCWREAGLADAFVHRTGHGIGLSVHEEPYIVAGNDLPLVEGMAFSVEPGIYFPGQWGARIEDIVIVTADGAEVGEQPPARPGRGAGLVAGCRDAVSVLRLRHRKDRRLPELRRTRRTASR